ncbi:hypothetical protein SDRG_15723 [Saprolegnia diclina VS20]|uniref:Helicase-associated domain-containing protein n=1 Tax=Saprolegnia diclina (strain VS20) TaxID=1156394 RepID=T0RAA2_SAPDV|nr:hypothetical protein SDRG_15723 [Saprolegnia diclina VS20]EQC26442.1 hypothetical protein SDRG_15723 [Saprolegnia diclina VS20]|eukprot:XP_008620127.1 hypothetical protein SDRG_15723 [Saprolegnia diclina VS20]
MVWMAPTPTGPPIPWVDPATLPKVGERLLGIGIYRRLYGHSYLPFDYIVPDTDPWPTTLRGKPLGAAIRILRAASRELKPFVEARLEELGLVWCNPDDRPSARCFIARSRNRIMVTWSAVLSALARYRDLYGHVCVPANWPVPEHDRSWPKEAWGIDLAQAAHTLDVHAYTLPTPQLRMALSLGAVHDVPLWADILTMLTMYYEQHGAADVPIDYVIRASRKRKADAAAPSYSPKYDGIPLGEVAMRVWLVSIQLPSHRGDELQRVRYAFNTPRSWANVVAAKTMFASIHGHDRVPHAYAVPKDDATWPSAMRGMRLGHYLGLQATALGDVQRVTTKVVDPFASARHLETEFDQHVLGLRIYKRLYTKDALVDIGFAVPHKLQWWPPKLWGLRLGDIVATLRKDGASLSALQRAMLNDISFVWDTDVAASWPDIVQTLQQWQATHRAIGWHDAFVLTSEWPSSVVGQTFGYLLTLLEVHEDFATKARRDTLRRFSLDIERRWSAKVRQLTAYYTRHGHLRVPLDHVVATEVEDPFWPAAGGGLPLGAIVSWLRQVPRAAMPYDKRRQLEMLKFEWDFLSSNDFTTPAPSAPVHDIRPATIVMTSGEKDMSPHVITIDDTDDDSDATEAVNWAMWAVALTQFKAHEGHVNIPSDYVVGAHDKRWPIALRSFPVGPILASVRSNVVEPPTWVQSQVQLVGVDWTSGKKAKKFTD